MSNLTICKQVTIKTIYGQFVHGYLLLSIEVFDYVIAKVVQVNKNFEFEGLIKTFMTFDDQKRRHTSIACIILLLKRISTINNFFPRSFLFLWFQHLRIQSFFTCMYHSVQYVIIIICDDSSISLFYYGCSTTQWIKGTYEVHESTRSKNKTKTLPSRHFL